MSDLSQIANWFYGTEYDPESEDKGRTGIAGAVSEPRETPVPVETAPVTPVEEEDERTFGERFRAGAENVGRFGLGLLEPLQAFQDPLFAVLAGARDPDRTIADYWKEIDWSAYAPGGERPNRPLTGKEILQIYGVKNDTTQRVGGFLADVLVSADMLFPLTWGAGAALRSAGKISRVKGLVDAGEELVDFARKGDDYLSLIPVTRGGTTRSLGIGTRRVAERVIPEGVRDGMVNASERVFREIFGVDNLGTFLRSTETGMGITNFISRMLPTSKQMQLRFGEEVGTAIFEAQGVPRQTAEDVRRYVLEQLTSINQLLGNDAPTFWNSITNAIGLRRGITTTTSGFSTATRDSILSSVNRIGDEQGAAVLGLGAEMTNRPAFLTGFLETVEEVTSTVVSEGRKLSASEAVNAEVARIRRIALDNGDDAVAAEEAFRRSLQIAVESDALVGYHLSMFEPVKNKFFQTITRPIDNLNERLGLRPNTVDEAVFRTSGMPLESSVWRSVLATGVNGGDVNAMTTFNLLANNGSIIKEVPIMDVFGVETMGDLLKQNKFFQQTDLDLGAYLRSLQEGHMRRSFAAFMDDRTFDTYTKALREGTLIPSNLLDETNAVARLEDAGFDVEGRLIGDYVTATENTILSRRNLLSHLIENGVSPDRARQALNMAAATGSDAYMSFVRKVEDAVQQYRKAGSAEGGVFGVSGSFTRARNALEEETLQLLGELSNPILALEETSSYLRSTLPRAQFLQNFYDIAERSGLVADDLFPGARSVKLAEDAVLGPFAGKYIHPFAEQVMNMALRRPEYRNATWLSRVMNDVRGGLLTGGNVLAINVLGGISTSMSVGINPLTYIQEMIGATRDFARLSRGEITEIADLEALKQAIPLNSTRLGDVAATERGVERMRKAAAGIEETGLTAFLDAARDTFRTFIDNPAELFIGQRAVRPRPATTVTETTTRTATSTGTTRVAVTEGGAALTGKEQVTETVRQAGALLGLQGFSGSETVMKLAAFRSALRQGFTPREAAELARINVFDYSELPEALTVWRDQGFLLFPGFPYFIASRNVAGLLRRAPQTSAAARIPDAIYDAQMDEDEKSVLIASLPEWLRKDIGIPIRDRTNANGDKIKSVIPFGPIFPNIAWTNPFLDTLDMFTSLGLFGPLVDIGVAYSSGTGQGPLSGSFGGRTFEEGVPYTDRIAQTVGFLYNSFAPTGVKKFYTYQPGRGPSGIIPSLIETSVELPAEIAEFNYTARELVNGRVERDLVDNIIAATLRNPQPIALTGQFASLQRSLNAAQAEYNRELATWQRRYEMAIAKGDQSAAQQALNRTRELQEKFVATWGPVLEQYDRYIQNQGTSPAVTP